jgi:hypothetical protein
LLLQCQQLCLLQLALFPVRSLSHHTRVRLGELKSQNPFPGTRAFLGDEFPLPRRLEGELAEVRRETTLHYRLRHIPRWIHGGADDHRRVALNGIPSFFMSMAVKK